MMTLTPSLKLTLLFSLARLATSTSTSFSCPGQGFYPDPSSCTSFYRCVDLERSYKYYCPSGTRYDPSLSNCNHEAVAPPCQVEEQTKPPKPTTRKPGTKPPTQNTFTKPVKPRPTTIRTTTRRATTTRRTTTANNPKQDTQVTVKDPVFPPPLSTPIPAQSPPSTSSSPTLIITSQPLPSRNYSVSPTSLYDCYQPNYYQEETTCEQFYACREIAPGVLAADRIFRCPAGYLFDSDTRLCQRDYKVACQKNKTEEFLFFTVLNALVVQLKENELEHFFSLRLQLPLTRPKTVINPKVTIFGGDENPYPWFVLQSAIH